MSNNKGYYLVLLFTIINLITLTWMMVYYSPITYLAEGVMGLLFLIFASVTLYLVSKNPRYGWPFSIFFFMMNILNSIYIFFFVASFVLMLYSLSSVAGLILSVYNVDSSVRRRVHRAQERTNRVKHKIKEKTKNLKDKIKNRIRRKK